MGGAVVFDLIAAPAQDGYIAQGIAVFRVDSIHGWAGWVALVLTEKFMTEFMATTFTVCLFIQ